MPVGRSGTPDSDCTRWLETGVLDTHTHTEFISDNTEEKSSRIRTEDTRTKIIE